MPPVVKPAPPTPVEVVRPERGEIQRWLNRPALVRARQQAILYAKITGYLKTLSVDEGDSVVAGQILAEIEVPELESEGAKCRAELEAARLEFDRLDAGRKKSPDLITPYAVDEAKARLDMALASLQRHETQVGFTRITAPFDGIVTKRWVDPGAFIASATASSRPETSALLTIMDFAVVRIEVAIPEPDVPFVTVGGEVIIRAEDGGERPGKVTRFAHALEESTRSMNAQVEMPNPDGSLRPGMSVSARVALEEHGNALLIPVGALVVEKLKTSVFLALDGVAKKRPVRAGFNDGVRVEILEGLSDEDAVILVGKLSLSDGRQISAISDAALVKP